MGEISLRESQETVASYEGGYMGVSAVPGSGKTTTLCALAVRLIKNRIKGSQRVLIVTYQNAAVANIQTRIMKMLDSESLLPTGYDVRTLHSLSRGILKENPGLIGLDQRFEVLDENTVARILDNAVDLWCRVNAGRMESLRSKSDVRSPIQLKKLIRNVGKTVMDSSKDSLLNPNALLDLIESRQGVLDISDELLKIGAEIYADYQKEIESRGAVDFNDLVRYSVRLLRDHPDILLRYRNRWPFILEDEAQDSVPLQQDLLSMLSGQGGNWVRVGDPNQAIMSTFTSAEPAYLMQFLDRPDVEVRPLLQAGRSGISVINLANDLVKKVVEDHPIDLVKKLSFRKQFIEPTKPGDPQENPPESQSKVFFHEYPSRSLEVAATCDRVMKWMEAYRGKDFTYAILTPNNNQGADVISALKERKAPHVEMLKTSSESKKTASGLSDILELLCYPAGKPSRQNAQAYSITSLLNKVYHFVKTLQTDTDLVELENMNLRVFQGIELEDFLYPSPIQRKYLVLENSELEDFRIRLKRWFDALILPIDQLILTITDDILKKEKAEVGRRIASLVKGWSEDDPHLTLPELSGVLIAALNNNRVRLEDEMSEMEPQVDKVSVSTLHKSKGLEWDFVFVLHAGASRFHYDFNDRFFGEYRSLGGYPAFMAKSRLLQILNDRTHLDEPRSIANKSSPDLFGGSASPDTVSSFEAKSAIPVSADPKADVIAEDMRLLYVAITRAKRVISISWNTKEDGKNYEVKASRIVQELAAENG